MSKLQLYKATERGKVSSDACEAIDAPGCKKKIIKMEVLTPT